MKWYSIDKKDLTDFKDKYIFSKGEGDWTEGRLQEVKYTAEGKTMTLQSRDGYPEDGGYKFWAKPVAPSEK